MPHKRLRLLFRIVRAAVVTGISLACIAAIFFILLHPATPLNFPPTPASAHNPPQAAGLPHYTRDEVDTFYTYPEWYIVWSYQAKADHQTSNRPSTYSYFGDIRQYWQAYGATYSATRSIYPTPTGDHIMLAVIGTSFTVEYTLKGLYEKTIGALSEASSHHRPTEEDAYAARVAEDYAAFVHIRPFYEYSFSHALRGLWTTVPFHSTHFLRSVERRAWLTTDYAVESFYCWLIELGTHATYGYEDTTTEAWVTLTPEAGAVIASPANHTKILRTITSYPSGLTEAIVELPRYQEFTPRALDLLHQGAAFHQIAGNQLILISVIATENQHPTPSSTQQLIAQPLLTTPGKTRVALLAQVANLPQIIHDLEASNQQIEHIYDY